MAEENGLTVDEAGFVEALNEQKAKSRASVTDKVAPDVAVYAQLLNQMKEEGVVEESGVVHLIYENLDEVDTTVAGIVVDGADCRRGQPGRAGRDRAAGDALLRRERRPDERHRRTLLLPGRYG